MSFEFRPHPDIDGPQISLEAGWLRLDLVEPDPYINTHEVADKSFEEARLATHLDGYSGYLRKVGFVTDVCESQNGDRFILPAPKPKNVKAVFFKNS